MLLLLWCARFPDLTISIVQTKALLQFFDFARSIVQGLWKTNDSSYAFKQHIRTGLRATIGPQQETRSPTSIVHSSKARAGCRCLPELSGKEDQGRPLHRRTEKIKSPPKPAGSHQGDHSATHAVLALPVRIENSSVSMRQSVAKPRRRPRSASMKRPVTSSRRTRNSSA